MRFIISVTTDVQLKLIVYQDCQSIGLLNSIHSRKKNFERNIFGWRNDESKHATYVQEIVIVQNEVNEKTSNKITSN